MSVAAQRLRERVYATITMVAVVVGLAEEGGPRLSHNDAAWTVGGTAVALWLAVLVADEQAHRMVFRRAAQGANLRRMLYTSSPLLLSAVGPLLFTGVSALGAMKLHVALLTAVGIDVAELFVWGVVGGVRLGAGLLPSLAAGVADLAVGLGVVAVKVWTAH